MNVGGRHFSLADIVIGVSLLVGLVTTFLPWYAATFNCDGLRPGQCLAFGLPTISSNAFGYWSGWFFFIAVVVGLVLYVLRTFTPTVHLPDLPQTDSVLYMILGAVMVVMAVLWLIFGAGATTSGPGYSAGPSFGLIIGIIAGIAVIAGGYLKRADAVVAPAGHGTGHGAGYGAAPPPPGPTYGGSAPPPPAAP